MTNTASIEARLYREPGTELWTVTSYLQLELRRDHFTESGRIKVRCTASLYRIHWQTTENSAERERPKAAMVAASNAADARPYWSEKTKITGKLFESWQRWIRNWFSLNRMYVL